MTLPLNEPHEVAPALVLFNDGVEEVFVDTQGDLHLKFSSGKRIDVASGDPYEAWQIYFPDGGWWVGLPGGGISTYQPDPPGSFETVQKGRRWRWRR